MILVIVSLVGIKSICYFPVVDDTMAPTFTAWLLILFVGPSTGSDGIAELFPFDLAYLARSGLFIRTFL